MRQFIRLHIIAHDIANQQENYTRFVVVARKAIEVDPQFPSKTSLMMVTSHQEGSLVECLNVFHRHGINVCKLESRPRMNEPFRYSFYVDIEANVFDSHTAEAIEELEKGSRRGENIRQLSKAAQQRLNLDVYIPKLRV